MKRILLISALLAIPLVASADPDATRVILKVIEEEIARLEPRADAVKQDRAQAEDWREKSIAAFKLCHMEKRCTRQELDAVMASTEMANNVAKRHQEYANKLTELYMQRAKLRRDLKQGR